MLLDKLVAGVEYGPYVLPVVIFHLVDSANNRMLILVLFALILNHNRKHSTDMVISKELYVLAGCESAEKQPAFLLLWLDYPRIFAMFQL